MRFTILLILTVLLSGCSKTTPTDIVGNAAKESINTIIANKPTCKDVGITCNKQIDAVISSCDNAKKVITEEKIRWKISFFGLLLAIMVFIIKKVLK